MNTEMIAATGNEQKMVEIRQILASSGIRLITMKDAGLDLDIVGRHLPGRWRSPMTPDWWWTPWEGSREFIPPAGWDMILPMISRTGKSSGLWTNTARRCPMQSKRMNSQDRTEVSESQGRIEVSESQDRTEVSESQGRTEVPDQPGLAAWRGRKKSCRFRDAPGLRREWGAGAAQVSALRLLSCGCVAGRERAHCHRGSGRENPLTAVRNKRIRLRSDLLPSGIRDDLGTDPTGGKEPHQPQGAGIPENPGDSGKRDVVILAVFCLYCVCRIRYQLF